MIKPEEGIDEGKAEFVQYLALNLNIQHFFIGNLHEHVWPHDNYLQGK